MPDYTFFIWIPIALIQIVLFSIFLFKGNKNDKSVDIIPIVNYNNMTYWKDDKHLYREKVGSMTMSKRNAQVVNQLESGLNPSELMYIIKLLEDE